MADRTCPHCLAVLPPVRDIYCSDCGRSVDEPTDEAVLQSAREAQKAGRSGGRPGINLGTWMMLGGVCSTVVALAAAQRRDWPDAIYTGAGALVMLVVGVFWHGRTSSATRAEDAD